MRDGAWSARGAFTCLGSEASRQLPGRQAWSQQVTASCVIPAHQAISFLSHFSAQNESYSTLLFAAFYALQPEWETIFSLARAVQPAAAKECGLCLGGRRSAQRTCAGQRDSRAAAERLACLRVPLRAWRHGAWKVRGRQSICQRRTHFSFLSGLFS